MVGEGHESLNGVSSILQFRPSLLGIRAFTPIVALLFTGSNKEQKRKHFMCWMPLIVQNCLVFKEKRNVAAKMTHW